MKNMYEGGGLGEVAANRGPINRIICCYMRQPAIFGARWVRPNKATILFRDN